MTDLYTDLTNERNALLHELNTARAQAIALEAQLDKSEVARYALMGEVVESRQKLTADFIVISKLNQDREKLHHQLNEARQGIEPIGRLTLDDIPSPNWHRAALIAGEYMATKGPDDYYKFTPTEWLAWVIDIADIERPPLTLTDRGLGDGYETGVIEP